MPPFIVIIIRPICPPVSFVLISLDIMLFLIFMHLLRFLYNCNGEIKIIIRHKSISVILDI